jgi:hypothetical protein
MVKDLMFPLCGLELFLDYVADELSQILLCYSCQSVNASIVLTRLSGPRSGPTTSKGIW